MTALRTPTLPPSRRVAPLLMLVVTLLGSLAHAQGGVEIPSVPAPINLEGWEYRWDPPLPSAPAQPLRWEDSASAHWLPTQPGLRLPNREGRDDVWFRVRLPNVSWDDAAVFFTGIDSDFVAYVDGTPIYRSPGPFGARAPGWPWYLFRVPPSSAGHTLYLRVHSSNPLTLGPFGDTLTGSRSDLMLRTLTRDLGMSLIGLLSMTFGLLALFVYLYQRKLRLYLWFGLFAIAQGAVFVSVCEAGQLVWDSPVGWVAVLWTGRALYPATFLAFFAEALGFTHRARLIKVAGVIAAAGILVSAMAVVEFPLLRRTVFWYLNLDYFACTLGVITLAVRYVRRTGRGKGALLGGLVLLSLYTPNLLRSMGLVIAPELSHWGYLLLLLGMGSTLLRQFASVHGALQQHAHALEDRNRRLEEVEATLKEAVRGRDAFLSIASHELRTPLAIITNNAHLLLRQPGSGAEGKMQLEEIHRQARHLARMVEDLLDLSRIAHGKLLLKPEPLALVDAVEESLRTLRIAAEGAGVKLHWVPPPSPLWSKADPTRLDQIVGNLVRNALKYTEPGGTVELRLCADEDGAALTIRDDGAGIAPEVLPRLFQLFVQGAPSRERSGSGLGVGLALVRQLVEMHGGRVTAQSEGPGRGSTFQVRLPICEAPAQPVEVPCAPATASAPIRVLLVEDNRNLRLSLKLALRLQGFEISEANDGEEGLRKMLEEAVDVALVDIAMPRLDGFTLANRVRASPLSSRLRLIALTGYGQPQDRAKAEASGFDRLLVKPVDPDEVGRVIRELDAAARRSRVA